MKSPEKCILEGRTHLLAKTSRVYTKITKSDFFITYCSCCDSSALATTDSQKCVLNYPNLHTTCNTDACLEVFVH